MPHPAQTAIAASSGSRRCAGARATGFEVIPRRGDFSLA
jgi:hypothetical protein